MISVSFSHKSGLIFFSLFVSHMGMENSNESWEVSFKSAESKAATSFASRWRKKEEWWFTLGLRILDFKQKFRTYVPWEVGQISQMSFFCQWNRTMTGNMTRAQWVMWDRKNYHSRLHQKSWAPRRRGSCHLVERPTAAQHCDLFRTMFLHVKHQEGENCTASGTLT